MNRLLILLSVLLAGCSMSIETLSDNERWALRADHVEIIRDDFGVPHIYGRTDADAVFGLLYAQCEDDFNRVERNYIWATGRLAEVEGESAIYSDLRANLYMTQKEAKENFRNSPEWLQELCVAFADGVNYYLHTHPEVKPKLLTRFEPWMPMYFSEGSIGGDIERIATRGIRDFYGKSNEVGALHDGLLRLNDEEPRGSNGIALSGKMTESGNAMLLINPHTSFFFRGEVHMVSDEGLNAYGAVTWGQFFIYQGFNEKNGWMHTSTGTDVRDEFEETILKSSEGLHYQYGNETRPVDSIEVSLKYKSESGISEKTFMTYRTHHGPITHQNEDKWVSTAIMWDPVKALIQSYTRTKTNNYEEFNAMMEIRTNSSNNTVYADVDGNIAYYHGNFIPVRNDSIDYSRPVNGSDPTTDWKGLHTVDESITLLNPGTGWIQNCNSTPFTAAGAYSPKAEDFPKYMTSYPENFRGIHALAILDTASNLSLDGLIRLGYDPYLPGAELLISGLVEALEKGPRNDELELAFDILGSWDYRVGLDSKAMTICHYYLAAYYETGKAPRAGRNESMLYMGKQSSSAERLEVLKQALENLKDDFGTTEVAWGEFNRYQRLDGAIRQQYDDNAPSIPVGMASGSWGALASFGARRGENTKRQYGVAGNSFVAVVEFGDKVKAKSLLAGGQSGDPESPHFDDQAQRYADAQFKEVAYYREDVEKRAVRTYRPGL